MSVISTHVDNRITINMSRLIAGNNKNTNAVDKVVFNKLQLSYLERLFGTWSEVGMSISPDSNPAELTRRAGQQQVIDEIRRKIPG